MSYDVIEHVKDPRLSLAEIYRVLRPGGTAFLAFPVYDGAMSRHLDYITRLPGLHSFYSPETLISAVNSLLGADGGQQRFGTHLQPQPRPGYGGKRSVLPMLNGLTGNGFLRMISSFEVVDLRFRLFLSRSPILGAPIRALIGLGVTGFIRDALTANVVCELRKPDRVVVASDACTDRSEEMHDAGLLSFGWCFGNVRSTRELWAVHDAIVRAAQTACTLR